MGLAVDVERGGLRVGPETDGAGLVRGRADRHPLVQVEAVREQVVRMHAELAQHAAQLVRKPVQSLDVVLLVQCEVDVAVAVERDAVARLREVLAAQPEVDRVVGEHLERHVG